MAGSHIPKDLTDMLELTGMVGEALQKRRTEGYRKYFDARVKAFIANPKDVFNDSELKLYMKSQYADFLLATVTKTYDELLEEKSDAEKLAAIKLILDERAEQTAIMATESLHFSKKV
ncbi:MAG: hypothetical protein DRQ47_10530 [Gammaproteobacteria bacterium]|nr:MAG: hypothetical protein DRQ47_10530 [Gammaproteobacteria bacterium]